MVKGQQLDRVESPVVHGLSAAEKSRTVGLVDLYIYILIFIYIYINISLYVNLNIQRNSLLKSKCSFTRTYMARLVH